MATPAELEAAKALLDAEKEAQKVTFDERQQTKINELIQDAQSRAAKELRNDHAALKSQTDALKAELEAAKAALSKAKTTAQKGAATEDIEALQLEMKNVVEGHRAEVERLTLGANAKAKEASDARSEIANYRRDAAISAAVSQFNFYDPSSVAKLTSDQIQLNEAGKYVVIGELGQPRMNALYEPMTLAEFYAEYAEKNKWQVRGDVKGGVGSTQRGGLTTNGKYELHQVFGPKSVTSIVAEVAKDMGNYRRLKAQAVAAGLIPA